MNRNADLRHGLSLAPIRYRAVPEAGAPVRSRFIVPMRARIGLRALPATYPSSLPGGPWGQAFVRVLSVPLLGGVRGGFMVPMHAQRE